MKRYYITDPTSKDMVEVTEEEFYSLIGTEETRPYANQVYYGDISIEDVPENLREQVQTILNYKIAHCGEYDDQNISADELKAMLEGVI